MSDDVLTISRIVLPFHVQIHMDEKSNLFFRDSAAKMVIVHLKDMEKSYFLTNDRVFLTGNVTFNHTVSVFMLENITRPAIWLSVTPFSPTRQFLVDFQILN